MATPPSPKAWSLKGEGNANLVFAYSGQDPQLAGLVLRVRKGKTHAAHAEEKHKSKSGPSVNPEAVSILEDHIWQGVLQATDQTGREYEYVASYVSGLLGADYVHPGVRVHVPDEVVSMMLQQGMAPPPDLPALLMPDLASFTNSAHGGYKPAGPVVCVEIKPKAGCMPDSPHLDASTAHLKARYPRFLMHCVLKHKQGKGSLSTYDPRDLFSRDHSRMRRALNALLAAPNNNLRVFVGGQLVYGGRPAQSEGDSGVYANHPSSTSTSQLAEALEAAFGGSGSAEGGLGAVEQLLDVVCEVLQKEELLPRVLQLQQMDKVDIEGALPLYRALLEGYSATAGTGSASPSSGKVWADYDEPAALAALRGYLTAMTAKDCGIMITLQPLQQASGGTSPPVSPSKVPSSTQQAAADAAIAPSGAAQQQIAAAWPEPEEAVGAAGSLLHPAPKLINIHGTGSSSESCFMYRVAALDLDLKHITKLPAHAKLDADVLAAAAAAPELCEALLAGQLGPEV